MLLTKVPFGYNTAAPLVAVQSEETPCLLGMRDINGCPLFRFYLDAGTGSYVLVPTENVAITHTFDPTCILRV